MVKTQGNIMKKQQWVWINNSGVERNPYPFFVIEMDDGYLWRISRNWESEVIMRAVNKGFIDYYPVLRLRDVES